MSMADLDFDGDLDVVINNLGTPARLFENRLCGGDHLQIDLRAGRKRRHPSGKPRRRLTSAASAHRLDVRSTVCLTVPLEVLSMAQLPEIIPVRDLRQETAAVLKRVQSSGQPVVITQRGRAAAVLLSADAYERSERERHVLRLLVRGEQEITAGIGHDLDDVLAEADAILARDRP